MFISNAEANSRLHSSKNVLTKIVQDGDSRGGVAHVLEPPTITSESLPDLTDLTDLTDLPEEDRTCASAKAAGIFEPHEEPSGILLRKMLGMGLGRKKGETNLPVEVRAATAVCAELVNTRTAASVFEVSHHHADELKHGFTHQAARYGGDDPDAQLEKVVNEQKRQVRDLAFEKLTKTLGLMSDDKLMAVTDPLKLARISRDLSAVVDKTLPKEQSVFGGVHFHVWKPELREESSYDVITVNAPA